jgi:hypothetical protein
MAVYGAYVPQQATPGAPEGIDRAVLVRDGFHWLAFLFPALWLLFNRLWLALVAYVLVAVGLGALGHAGLPEPAVVVAGLLIMLFVGITSADLKGWGLERRGFRLADLVSASDGAEAETRFAARWTAELSHAPAPRAASASAPPGGSSSGRPVLGLFPDAGGTR